MKRIDKRIARKLYEAKKPFFICACNMYYTTGFYVDENFSLRYEYIDSFDKLVNAFEYYNCDNERGRYAAYYVENRPERAVRPGARKTSQLRRKIFLFSY